MISVPSALIEAIVLLLVILLWVRAEARLGNSDFGWSAAPRNKEERGEACPPEFVKKIFSEEDLKFISGLKSPQLESLYHRERNGVAIHWVQETASGVREIMRHHVEASRLSEDLEFATEVKVFLQYAQLRIICVILVLLIELAGSQRVHGMALYALGLTQSMGGALKEFEAGTATREWSKVEPS